MVWLGFFSDIIAKVVEGVPYQRLVTQKMMTVNELVKGPLFLNPESRSILLPSVLSQLKTLLETNEEVSLF